MIKVEELIDIIELGLWTPYVANEKPVSLLITAPVEAGKSEMVKLFRLNNGILLLTDATAWGIAKHYAKGIEAGLVRTIIVPDLMIPISRHRETAEAFIAFLTALLEEGVIECRTAFLDLKVKGIRANLITTLARDFVFDKRHRWSQMGFLSRMLPVSYSYSLPTVVAILDSIVAGEYRFEKPINLKFPSTQVSVECDPRYGYELEKYSMGLAKAQEIYGFRFQKQLQTLAMANALRQGRFEVRQEDIDLIAEYTKYFNLEYKPI